MTDPRLGPSPAQIDRMRRNIGDLIAARRRERSRRVRTSVIVGAAAAALVVSAASIVVVAMPPEVTAGSYACFTDDDLGATTHTIGYPDDLERPQTTADQVAAAVELCAVAFHANGLEPPADPTVCRLADLRLGVFPNAARLDDEALCTSLGLAVPETPLPGAD